MCETILDLNQDPKLYMELEVPLIRPQTNKNPMGTSQKAMTQLSMAMTNLHIYLNDYATTF